MQNLLNSSKNWREKVKKVLSGNNEVTIESVQELVKEGESLNIDEENYLAQLRNKLNKAIDFQDQCRVLKTSPQEK